MHEVLWYHIYPSRLFVVIHGAEYVRMTMREEGYEMAFLTDTEPSGMPK
jgi:hypothetical protein